MTALALPDPTALIAAALTGRSAVAASTGGDAGREFALLFGGSEAEEHAEASTGCHVEHLLPPDQPGDVATVSIVAAALPVPASLLPREAVQEVPPPVEQGRGALEVVPGGQVVESPAFSSQPVPSADPLPVAETVATALLSPKAQATDAGGNGIVATAPGRPGLTVSTDIDPANRQSRLPDEAGVPADSWQMAEGGTVPLDLRLDDGNTRLRQVVARDEPPTASSTPQDLGKASAPLGNAAVASAREAARDDHAPALFSWQPVPAQASFDNDDGSSVARPLGAVALSAFDPSSASGRLPDVGTAMAVSLPLEASSFRPAGEPFSTMNDSLPRGDAPSQWLTQAYGAAQADGAPPSVPSPVPADQGRASVDGLGMISAGARASGKAAATDAVIVGLPAERPVSVEAAEGPDRSAVQTRSEGAAADKSGSTLPPQPAGTPPDDMTPQQPEQSDLWAVVVPDRRPAESMPTLSQVPTASHAPVQHNVAAVVSQIVAGVRHHRDRPVELMLSPEELGTVRISLTAVDGTITAILTADRSETLDLMRRSVDVLERQFRDAGFESLSFSFGQGEADRRPAQLPATGWQGTPSADLAQDQRPESAGDQTTSGAAAPLPGRLNLRL